MLRDEGVVRTEEEELGAEPLDLDTHDFIECFLVFWDLG